ncbi:glycoside hydrolase family 13 protein [Cellulomonas gilvus]|uniref:Alpha amylase catalytic region n=1 Tax=Cellulomonas gilvus (strain ATCC 13127 / NRRL B-14078) TaxID=593907 RepID=F8A2D2_CELGA|nr:glycoside hydrolase family 13 protein [Cellulomonas gilvus]AEI11789.1 alpha amylase catalytic region [Cellulomonas gilvus ATCC 13127]
MTAGHHGGHLLDRPHHDGSELYVERGTPRLGDVVPVRVRVPASRAERAVHVRVVRDGEPRFVPARLDRSDEHDRWYVADVPVHNPVTQYRFLLDEPDGYRWLDGRGLHARDVPDAADFRLSVHAPAPRWLDDAVVYQVFPDRFARSTGHDGPPRGPLPDWALPAAWDDEPIAAGRGVAQQLFGGDLGGVEAHLDHLQRLGVDTLYLTPVFPARSNHRYDATSFARVDPLLGGDAALASLSAAVHARGMRIMGDLTTNHTGAGHEWFARARADRTSPEAQFYYWTEQDPGYVGWLEHASLPKLNYNAPELAARMVEGDASVTAQWLRPPFSLDGWRIDVANMTGRYRADDHAHAVARAIRATMARINPQAALVSEHFHDAAADLLAGGWHVNMNYSAFTRPVWTWLAEPGTELPFLGMPVPLPRRDARSMVATMRDFDATVPWSVTRHQWNMLGSHDTARIRTVVGSREAVEVAAALLLTYPGTPVVFAGDEGGLTGTNGEHARATMPWAQVAAGGGPRWDGATFATYRRLIALRRSSRALREGGLRWAFVEPDAVGYLRETADERVLVVLARDAWPGTRLPRALGVAGEVLHGGAALTTGPDGLVVPATDGPCARVWRLT